MREPATVVIAATGFELEFLGTMLQARPDRPLLDFPVSRAPGPDADILLVISGPGMANAAAACAAAIERFRPGRIFSTGICGAYAEDPSLRCRPVVGASAVFADTGAADETGFSTLCTMGLPLARLSGSEIFNSISLDDAPVSEAVCRADFLTVACVSGASDRARALQNRFPAAPGRILCEDMESAAVGLVAFRSATACTVVRGISNLCGSRDRRDWDMAGAARSAQETLLSAVQK